MVGVLGLIGNDNEVSMDLVRCAFADIRRIVDGPSM